MRKNNPILVTVETDEDVSDILRYCRVQSGVTQEQAEHDIGLTAGHLGKIEHGGKTWGKGALKMTQSLLWLLEYYGLKVMIVDMETATRLSGASFRRHSRTHLQKTTRKQHSNAQRLLMRLVRRPL